VQDNTPLLALEQLAKAGKPMAGILVVKLNWQSDFSVRDIKTRSPKTKVMLRWFREREPGYDWTKVTRQDGINYANDYYNQFDGEELRLSDVDQIICEPGGGICPPVQVSEFWHGVMDVAAKKGRKVGILCYAERNPPLPIINANQPHNDFWEHPAVIAMLRRAMREGHVLCLHQYVFTPDQKQGQCYPWDNSAWQQDKLYRHQLIYKLLPPDLQALPLWVVEWGDLRTPRCGPDSLKRNIQAVMRDIANDKMLYTICLWTCGHGGSPEWMMDDLTQLTPAYVDAVLGR
jgi:hypothetical protein